MDEEEDFAALEDAAEGAEGEEDEHMEPLQDSGHMPSQQLGDPSTWDTLPADLGEAWILGGCEADTAAEEAPVVVVEPSPEDPEVLSKADLDTRIKELEYLVCIFNVVLMHFVV